MQLSVLCKGQQAAVACYQLKPCYACCAGLWLCSLALQMAASAQRLIPEALTFASTLLATALPTPATAVAQAQQWLLPVDSWAGLSTPVPALSLVQVLQSPSDHAAFAADSFSGSLLQAALGVVDRAADVFAQLPSFPELFASAASTLGVLRHTKGLPQVWQRL